MPPRRHGSRNGLLLCCALAALFGGFGLGRLGTSLGLGAFDGLLA